MADHSPAPAQNKPSPDAEAGYAQQYENITSTSRIIALLRPLMENHSIITATLPDCGRFFNTALLAIDTDHHTITIDELNPKEGHALLIKAGRVRLQALIDGVETNFNADLKQVGSEKGIAYYQLALPQSIRYLQRRSDFRVTVSAARQINVEISLNEKSYSGELSDISAGGMCIRFPRKKTLDLEHATEEVQCQIKLPGKGEILCTFKVCHSQLHQPSDSLHIGGRFEHLDKSQRRTIERFVVELQRKTRQKMSRE